MSSWGNWNKPAGHPLLPRFIRFHFLLVRNVDFKFAARPNHRPTLLSRQAQVASGLVTSRRVGQSRLELQSQLPPREGRNESSLFILFLPVGSFLWNPGRPGCHPFHPHLFGWAICRSVRRQDGL